MKRPRPHDDLLQRIDATLESLFPPDESLGEEHLDAILDFEIGEDDDDGSPSLRIARIDDDILYGIVDREVIFVDVPTADAIDAALPRVHTGELEWEDAIPWVQRDQEDLLPADIVERYGTYGASAVDGPVVTFRADEAARIVEELEERGARCTRDDERVDRVCFG